MKQNKYLGIYHIITISFSCPFITVIIFSFLIWHETCLVPVRRASLFELGGLSGALQDIVHNRKLWF